MRRLAAGLATAGLLAGVTGAAAAPASAEQPATGSLDAPAASVTLITGDRVELRGDGSPPSVIPAEGRGSVSFRVTTDNGRTRVVPVDAAGLIAEGRLDPRLFDVTTLLEFGYDDAHRPDLPLIVQHEAGVAAASALAGATVTRQLPSVSGAAIAQSKKDTAAFWAEVTGAGAGGQRALGAGLAKVWLNGKRQLTLDRSTAQIGAPAAWQAGLTGKRVSVAIVDSGIDTGHPDLAGKVDAAANFTDEEPGDHVGHGTHVASTVAGTGAASGGQYRGVAPDVRLLDAKACTAEDGCPDDAVLAAMEWAAAEQRAPVVNMSLGGMDTPGLDPLEQAVNALSARYGTLFVIAAGNAGPHTGSLDSPGSADAALTVGAVDRQDVLADFSSRGPRVGDTGLKPDVTAPGVGIVAARAAGSESGEPVGEQYVALSGTSMATPHVAGAAALLLEQHPDWTGAQLKAALMASAKATDGVGAFDQGAGRVDVARAISQPVTAAPASLDYGMAQWPHEDDQPLVRTVTYRNTGTTEVSLDLAVLATDETGGAAPPALFTVRPSRVVLPAGGTAEVTVTADTRSADVPVGRYSGRLVATGGATVVTTPLGVAKEAERYAVTMTHIGRDGATPGSYVTFVDRLGDCGGDPACGDYSVGSAATSTLRLPPGRYTLADFSTTAGRDDETVLMQPVLDVTRDVSVTLDARLAKPIELTVPHKSARLMGYNVKIARDMLRPGVKFGYTSAGDANHPVHTAGLGTATAKAELVSMVDGKFAEPGPNGDFVDSPYEYNLAGFAFGQVFTGMRLQPAQQDFATVETSVAAITSEPRAVKISRSATPVGAPDDVAFAPVEASLIATRVPFTRTAHFLAAGLRWSTLMSQGDLATGRLDYSQTDAVKQVYQPGQTYQQRWGWGVFGPAFSEPRYTASNGLAKGVLRQGDHLMIGLTNFIDGQPGHTTDPKAVPGSATLYRDGQLVRDWPRAGYVAVDVPAQSATYRLESTLDASFSQVSTRISSAWTFRSGHVDGTAPAALPLLAVRYTPKLDNRNHAPALKGYRIPIEVQRQPGAPAAEVTAVTVEVSHDDGATWKTAPVSGKGAIREATVDNPAGGSVSLRAVVTDSAGNRVEQTIIRAYLVN